MQELTNKFIEFITYNSSNITLNQARDIFFNSNDIKRIFLDMQSPLIKYYNTIISVIYLDFTNLSISQSFVQTIFHIILLVINIIIIICLQSIIIKGEKYKKLFSYFLEISKKL